VRGPYVELNTVGRGLAELPMRTQRERGCNREGGHSGAVDPRSCEGRCGGQRIHSRDARTRHSAEMQGGCSAGEDSVAGGSADGEGGARCTAHGRGHAAAATMGRWMWDATGVLTRKRRRWFYSARIGEQDWHGGRIQLRDGR
jgi:hypothetical protein